MDVFNYIKSFLSSDHTSLDYLAKEYDVRRDIQPSVGLEVGKFLGMLIRLTGATRILELGSCIGYSTMWLSEGMKQTNGKVISIEYNKKLYDEAKENLAHANLLEYAELIHGDANNIVKQLPGKFDIILQDSNKLLYPDLLEQCIKLTRKNGIIIADDTLFKPMDIPNELSDPVHRYNELVFSDKRLYSTILPIGDGITVSVKLDD
ncbi:O-methyltransferase [Haloplasma contractile]|uniref:Trans-aconitate 2-methyltransferase protein n=1 Tax=Haloplasma contractile SSD-17B TaxID=1033810 RepID=U2EE08_9MOLU|nr:O-methyltransferase [Haloplasma contractile]ERJ13228.1 trans-aconitate 2-methyltransferase protein [Haloplasma contractile SSD-17B]